MHRRRRVLRGRPRGRDPDLEAGYEQVEASGDTFDPGLRFTLAVAREAAGDTDGAMAGYADTAGDDQAAGRLRARAAMRAGDLRLDADPAAAVAWYDLALAALDANGLTRDGDYHGWMATALGARGLAAVTCNDRAVARLRALQPAPDAPPDCADGEARARCELAREDAAAAAAADPERAPFWMNVGWSARLLGDAAAARAALETAVRLDPTLYPAFNDLGVLLAADGDLAGGRAAFAAAMSAAPDYGLARWNAGIADLADWPAGLVEGQLALADAMAPARDRSLAHSARLSDRRADVPLLLRDRGGRARRRGDRSLVQSIGAVVLAGAGSVATLAQLPATMAGGALTTTSPTRGVAGTADGIRPLAVSVRASASDSGVRSAWAALAWRARDGRRRHGRAGGPGESGGRRRRGHGDAGGVALAFAMPPWCCSSRRGSSGGLIPAAWAPGAAVAVLSLPFQAASGPFPGRRSRSPAGGHRRAWRLHLVAPFVGALVGLLAYLAFLVEPLPILRLGDPGRARGGRLPCRCRSDRWTAGSCTKSGRASISCLACRVAGAAFSVGIL